MKMRRGLPASSLSTVVVAAVVVACSTSNENSSASAYDSAATTISAEKYSKTCTQDSDCVAVKFHDTCKLCEVCFDSAIAQKDIVQYDRDVQEKRKGCPVRIDVTCIQCPEAKPACRSGTCAVEP